MTEHVTITKAPDTPETLDFEALLAAGIAAAQHYSGQEWTDYNLHDPGVTILETLVFALTDVAYRTDHPIEDILASSASTADPGLERQPFFPGPQAFASAPVTSNDYRKLLFDQVSGLRNAWILPHPGTSGAGGHYDVWIQPYATDVAEEAQPARLHRQIEDDAMALLRKTRALGVDFRHVRIAPTAEFALCGDVTLAPEADPEAALSAMLFAAEIALNPPPRVEDIDEALASSAAPETLFEGPALELGLIPDSGLSPPGRDIDLARIRAAIIALPQIETVHGLMAPEKPCPRGCDAEDPCPCALCADKRAAALVIPALSRKAADLEGLRVFRRGAQVSFDADKVLVQLRHREEKLRWEEHYAIRQVASSDYSRITLGNPARQLARYRSIQHMFPGVYGIGPDGVQGSAPLAEGVADTRAARDARQAQARQLKAYLAIFEQMLANHLAQLDATADLLALPSEGPSYHVQPLTRPEPSPDDAPALGPILGQPETPEPGRTQGWFTAYKDGLAELRDSQDRPLARRNRALDHLLARFGERIDTAELKRLYDDKAQPLEIFERWLLDRKAALLRDVIALGQGRGQGVDLAAPETCPLLRRIALRSGHDAPMFLIEHVLLQDDGLEARIGREEIGTSFAISAPLPRSTFRLAIGDRAVHWVLEPDPALPPLEMLLPQLRALGADPAHYTTSPERGYGTTVSLVGPNGLSIEVVENFRSRSHAADWIARMVATCQGAGRDARALDAVFTPVVMPLDFAARGATLALAPDASGTSPARRAYLADIVTEEMPAHTLPAMLWLDGETPQEARDFARAYAAWCAAQLCVRATRTPSAEALAAGAQASQTLRRQIHDLFCREFRALRARRRGDAVQG
ncbi:hypothetical protein Dshi_2457 [Dinoroseobacter shibae DFL 12 = DSM 16493]|jgi:hypothetical protein|uniref:Uncharacterized protein n=1 Tax=Dinoroseobacter shibae (strain DSM 16493 / NCIMB 14021 / DFL 12) TaxID=398580 RepID=A8LS98_DINSH|nr:hypothetical protein [Dinoroseobacter shibae]ABV94191.1 hypothetical protein Dshi_2457 [Dinoroseobacter shibae DFL 12 = DSM 16493]URF45632.1 hypothetical protein M8008_12685 [Dinoroseobacter shibae]URF49937.1 hypothetical protein M8007_12685 [Dinoroseobacter shibae]